MRLKSKFGAIRGVVRGAVIFIVGLGKNKTPDCESDVLWMGYWLSIIVLYFVSDRFYVRLYFVSRLSTIASYNVLISLLCSIASNVKHVSK